jgi:hypothetical protein
MSYAMDLNQMMNRFRLASRALFNGFFHVLDPRSDSVQAWLLEERFSSVEEVLFRKLVGEAASLPDIRYGDLQPAIHVTLRDGGMAPIMLNREIDSGHWDYPVMRVTDDARLQFVRFFDWDQLDYRDNQYVRVKVDHWPSHADAVGKHGLIETQYVKFVKG